MTQRQRLNLIVSSAVLLMVGLLLSVTATYAWLEISRIPFVSDVALNVVSESALLVAPDNHGTPGEWDTILLASEDFEAFGPLKPVTFIQEDRWFYKLNYNESGRTSGVEAITEDEVYLSYPEGESAQAAGTAAWDSGYVIAYDFWMSSQSSDVVVSLRDPQETTQEELRNGTFAIGTPKWDEASQLHYNSGNGAETTLRLGLELTKTDTEGNPTGETDFFVYEPNADVHPGGEEGYLETMSVKGGPLVSEDRLLVQDASCWEEKSPAEEEELTYKAGNFTRNRELFTLNSQELMKVRLWIWVEGQDPDCYALSYADGVQILCNLDFDARSIQREMEIGRKE